MPGNARLSITITGLVLLVSLCPSSIGYAGSTFPGPASVHDKTGSPLLLPSIRSPAAVLPLPASTAPGDNSTIAYYTYDTMSSELKALASRHSNIMQLYDLTSWIKSRFGFTKTWQGRIVWGVRISSDPVVDRPGLPKIVIQGGTHANEWMGFQTAMMLVELLVESYQNRSLEKEQAAAVWAQAGNGTGAGAGTGPGDNASFRDWSVARLSWLVDNREIWVVPMVNPDGVTYDQQVEGPNGGNPAWRKNCRDNNGDGIFETSVDGVDLNRNYPYMWAANQKGVTRDGNITYQDDDSDPASGVYHGPPDNYDDDGDAKAPRAPDWFPQHRGQDWNGIDEDPVDGIDNDGDGRIDEDKDGGFSEPETCAVSALFNALDSDGDHVNGHSDVTIAVDLHTYSGCVMWPWGYTYAPTAHASLMASLGSMAAQRNGYDSYQSVYMYAASGCIDDWCYGSMGVMYFTIEIGRDGNQPPSRIHELGDPNVDALLFLAEASGTARPAFEMMATSLDIGMPEIIHTPPRSVEGGKDLTVGVKVENATNLKPHGLSLRYRVDGGSWTAIVLSQKGVGRFEGVIPGQNGGSKVEYYLTAVSVFNTTVYLPAYAPYSTFSYEVLGQQIPSWGWGAAAGVVLVAGAAIAWRIRRQRMTGPQPPSGPGGARGVSDSDRKA